MSDQHARTGGIRGWPPGLIRGGHVGVYDGRDAAEELNAGPCPGPRAAAVALPLFPLSQG